MLTHHAWKSRGINQLFSREENDAYKSCRGEQILMILGYNVVAILREIKYEYITNRSLAICQEEIGVKITEFFSQLNSV